MEANRNGNVYLWTFTFGALISVKEGRRRWSQFLRNLRRWKKRGGVDLAGLRVFELHPGGHGLHIHVLTTCYLQVQAVRAMWNHCGGGRVHVKPIPYERRHYVGKYLRKQGRPECFRGARMWQAFGDISHLKVSEVRIESNWTRVYNALANSLSFFRGMKWFERVQAVENVERGLPWYYALKVLPSPSEPGACDPQRSEDLPLAFGAY